MAEEPSPGDIMFIVRGTPGHGVSATIKYRLIVMRMAQALAKKDGVSFEIGRAVWDAERGRWTIPYMVLVKYKMVWHAPLGAYLHENQAALLDLTIELAKEQDT